VSEPNRARGVIDETAERETVNRAERTRCPNNLPGGEIRAGFGFRFAASCFPALLRYGAARADVEWAISFGDATARKQLRNTLPRVTHIRNLLQLLRYTLKLLWGDKKHCRDGEERGRTNVQQPQTSHASTACSAPIESEIYSSRRHHAPTGATRL
jgi:hypothetical protein